MTDFSIDRLLSLWAMGSGKVFWRHDVDYVLECAVSMGELERSHGVTSTYYLRTLSDEEYDYAPQEIRRVAEVLKDLGHYIGLHVDLELERESAVSDEYVAKKFAEQKGVLDGLLSGTKVSLHRPPLDALWRHYPGLDHAMSPYWQGLTIADSRGLFRSDPERAITGNASLQVNLHPEWWFLPLAERDGLHSREMVKT